MFATFTKRALSAMVFVLGASYASATLAHHDYRHPYPEMWMPKKEVNWMNMHDYKNPVYKGYAVDFCNSPGRYCGRAAANHFCRANGYKMATQFHIVRHVGQTRNMCGGYVNKDGSRDSFHWIRCRG